VTIERRDRATRIPSGWFLRGFRQNWHLLRALVWAVLRRTSPALKAIDASLAVALSPQAYPLMFRGRLLEGLGRDDEAETTYMRAIGIEPDNAEAHLSLALFLMAHGRLREAYLELVLATRADPRNREVREAVAECSRRMAER
jgi:tetratricopeptide (TPR) repeat protein